MRFIQSFGVSSFAVAVACSLALDASITRGEEVSSGAVRFNRDIRPILSDICFPCHGPDKGTRVNNLRFDTEAGAFADLGGRRAIVPGDLARSEMFRRITAKDESVHMPPVRSGRRLTEQQIDLIRRWIEQGAKWDKHWSLIPPKRPELPKVRNS